MWLVLTWQMRTATSTDNEDRRWHCRLPLQLHPPSTASFVPPIGQVFLTPRWHAPAGYVNMTSSVFFKFRSSKEPQRISFDGTGITVFELKREIINVSGLGDGSDFDLHIYDESNPDDEYDDDTTIIPRSSAVVARRVPAARPGHGRAARYVTGKAPVAAKNSSRAEQSRTVASAKSTPAVQAMPDLSKAMTEEERIAALMATGSAQWEQQRQAMARYVSCPLRTRFVYRSNECNPVRSRYTTKTPPTENTSTRISLFRPVTSATDAKRKVSNVMPAILARTTTNFAK